jgi:hypothetical protein
MTWFRPGALPWTVVAVVMSAAWPAAQDRVRPAADLEARVLTLAGPGAVDCGRYLQHAPDSGVAAPVPRELEASLTCGRQATAEERPFWTFVQRRGVDSFVAHGVLGTPDGAIQMFAYDSAPCGGPGCEPSFTLSDCERAHVQTDPDDDPDFACEP